MVEVVECGEVVVVEVVECGVVVVVEVVVVVVVVVEVVVVGAVPASMRLQHTPPEQYGICPYKLGS